MAQLYAACRGDGPLVVRNVQLAPAVQNQLDGFFQTQEVVFNAGINTDVDFTGDWTPEPDELLVIRGHAEAQLLLAAAAQNAVALPVLDAVNFENEGVKALFTAVGPPGQRRLLVQGFSAQQLLSRKLAFLFDGNTFDLLTAPVFSLDNSLLATVDPAGDIRFKSFHLLRRVFELSQFYQQATDVELQAFCGHASLNVADIAGFVAGADEGIRKAVHNIAKSNVLGIHPVADIHAQAAAIGFQVDVNAGRIQVPLDRKGAKALFGFLLDKVYLGPMAQQLYITNSHRPL